MSFSTNDGKYQVTPTVSKNCLEERGIKPDRLPHVEDAIRAGLDGLQLARMASPLPPYFNWVLVRPQRQCVKYDAELCFHGLALVARQEAHACGF